MVSKKMADFKKLKYRLRDYIAYWQVFSRPEDNHLYQVKKLDPRHDSKDLRAAKKLHASVYLSLGFVDESEIFDEIIHEHSDPYQRHAEYFIVKKRDEVVAAARQIVYKGLGEHHDSFPVLDKAIIYDRSRNRLLGYHPTEIVEISALVKKRGESSVVPLVLYRALWRHSLASQHRIWVMACDPRLYDRLKMLFGPTFTKIGQRTPYKGADAIPVALAMDASVKYVHKVLGSRRQDLFDLRRRAARFMVKDIPR